MEEEPAGVLELRPLGRTLNDRVLAAFFWGNLAALLIIFFSQFRTPLWTPWDPPHFGYVVAHIAAAGFMTVIWYLHRKGPTAPRWLLAAVMLIGFAFVGYYFITRAEEMVFRAAFGTRPDLILGVLLFVQVLYLSWLYWGPIFPVLALIAVAYTFVADLLPGPFKGPSFELHGILTHFTHVMFGGSGGNITGLAARFFWLLVFWGLMMNTAGGGVALLGIAKLFSRTGLPGGAAIGALLASAFTGSFVGGGPSNVAITGPVTIPAMKKAGYTAAQAGSVEAIASNASSITPPILGIVAFVMTDLVGVSYVKIIVMSLVPAFLWFLAAAVYIIAHAKRHQAYIRAIHEAEAGEERISWHRYLRSGLLLVVPVGIILLLVMQGYTLRIGSLAAFLTLLALALALRVETRWSVWSVGMRQAAFTSSSITMILVALAVMSDVIVWTGLGGRLGGIIEDASHGYILIAGVIMLVFGVILGAGLPALPIYFIMSITFAPVLANMGLSHQVSHYTAFYIGTLSNIIPPIASSALVAAAVAGTRYWSVCIELTKMSWPLWIYPLLFLVAPELLLLGDSGAGTTVLIILTSAVVIIGAQAATAGWLLRLLPPITRIVLYANFGLLVAALTRRSEVLMGIAIGVTLASVAVTLLRKGPVAKGSERAAAAAPAGPLP